MLFFLGYILVTWAILVTYELWFHVDTKDYTLVDVMFNINAQECWNLSFMDRFKLTWFGIRHPWDLYEGWRDGEHPAPWNHDFLWHDYPN